MKNVELYPQKEIDNIFTAGAAIRKITTDLIEQYEAIEKLRPSIRETVKSYSDMVAIEQRIVAVEKAVEATSKQYNEEIKKRVNGLRALTPEEANARVETQAHNRELKLNAEAARYAEGSLAKMRIELRQMNDTRKLLVQGTPAEVVMTKNIQKLNAEVSAIEQSLGVYNRNVGNYASGFSAIRNNVTMLVNELPNLAQSPRIFFQAISNNLPMFSMAIAQESQKIRAEIAETGKSSTSITKQILSSFVSWQTGIVIAISLLTKYSDEIIAWVGSLFKGEKQALSTAEAMGKINDAMEVSDFGQKMANFKRLSELYAEVGDNAKAKEQFLKDYREELDDTGISVRNLVQADNLFIKNSAAYIEALKLRTQANAAQSLAEKEYAKQYEAQVKANEKIAKQGLQDKIDYYSSLPDAAQTVAGTNPLSGENITVEDNIIAGIQERIDKIRKKEMAAAGLAETYNDLFTVLDTKAQGIIANAGFVEIEKVAKARETTHRTRMSAINAERKAIEDLSTAEIDARMAVIERTLAADQTATADRMTLTNELYDLEEQRIKQLAEVQRANLIQRNIDENTTYNNDGSVASTIDEVTAAANVKNQLLLLQIATDQAMIDSVNDRIKEINALEDQGMEDSLRRFETQMQDRQRIIDQDESAELAALSAQYSGVLSNQQKYEEERLAVTRKYADLRQMAELEALETQLALLKSDSNITIDEQQKIADLEAQIADYKVEINRDANDRIVEDDERTRERRIENLKRIQDAAIELMDLMGEIAQLNADRQLADLDKQQKAAEDAAEEEQERIERLADAGAITEEQKNARIALSEQELAERQEIIDAQRAQIEKRQARFNVLLSTAQAIMKAVASAPWPLNLIPIGFATAFGAVQLAAVSAAQYAKGTPEGGHPGGLAWVGDGGRAEAVIYGGKAYKTPAIPTLMDLPKGAEVLPDWRDVIKSSLAHDLITEPVGHVTNYYDVPATAYNDKGVRLRLEKQINLTEQLIREIRKGRKADKVAEFRSRKLIGIN